MDKQAITDKMLKHQRRALKQEFIKPGLFNAINDEDSFDYENFVEKGAKTAKTFLAVDHRMAVYKISAKTPYYALQPGDIVEIEPSEEVIKHHWIWPTKPNKAVAGGHVMVPTGNTSCRVDYQFWMLFKNQEKPARMDKDRDVIHFCFNKQCMVHLTIEKRHKWEDRIATCFTTRDASACSHKPKCLLDLARKDDFVSGIGNR